MKEAMEKPIALETFDPKGCMYATEERIYGFATRDKQRHLIVPPDRYTNFLIGITDKFKQFVLEENKCDSLRAVAKKHLRMLQKNNPDRNEKELKEFNFSPLSMRVQGEIKYWKSPGKAWKREAGKVFPSPEHSEYILDGMGKWISLKFYASDLQDFVKTIKRHLDEHYPQRRQKFPGGFLWRTGKDKGEESIRDYADGFRFNLDLRSEPTQALDVTICLRDYGAISFGGLKRSYEIPAISVKAHSLFGKMSFVGKVVDSLEEVVRDHYEIGVTSYRTSYDIGTLGGKKS